MRKAVLTLGLLLALVGSAWATNSPDVVNVTLTDAGTEYSWTVPFKTVAMTVQSRTAADFKMATGSGESGTIYFTVKSGTSYYETSVESYDGTLYFQSPNAGQVIEIMYWQSN